MYGYGLGVRVMTHPEVADINGSVGEWGWDGSFYPAGEKTSRDWPLPKRPVPGTVFHPAVNAGLRRIPEEQSAVICLP